MRKFYSILGLLLMCGTSLFAQTNYTVTFTANVEMEKVQVKNLSSGETKMLYSPDNVITLQKVEKQGTPIASVDNPMFLQQTANNEVIVNMEKAGHLNLTLYSSNGSFIARYSNNVNAGQNAFQIGASTGMYVLVATAGGKSASLKLSLTQNLQPGIYEIITSKSDVFLKSVEDVITFYEGDTFEFIGYYYKQTDKKTAVITSDQAITFSFTKATAPTVTTMQATDITYDAVTIGGNVTRDNGAPVTERGICWNTTGNPTIEDNKETSGTGTGSFTATLSSLSDGTTFYARAYAINNEGTSYGDEVTFTTMKINAPSVSTLQATNILIDVATIDGDVTADNGASVTERGICWATTLNPTIADNKEVSGTGTGSFSVTLSSLSDGTTYYARAYAVNSAGISYGENITFTTKSPIVIEKGAIKAAFSVSESRRVHFSQGNLQYQASTNTWRFAEHQYDMIGDDNTKISSTYSGWIDLFSWGSSGWAKQPYALEREELWTGIGCSKADWGMHNKISNGGNQIGQWRTLTKDEWLYLSKNRPNAEELWGGGTVCGVQGLILLPDNWETPPSIKFKSRRQGSADYSGNVYSQDEWAVMQSYGAVFLPAAGRHLGIDIELVSFFGFYWSSSALNNYTVASCLSFSPIVKVATNSRCQGLSVRLVQENIITSNATNVTNSTATVGGKIMDDYGFAITERGVCWSTTENPTIEDNKKTSGTGTGNFSVELTSLSDGTTYYVRAYAISSDGVYYGETVSVTPRSIETASIKAGFSVSANKKVYFSMGNLQYQASTNTWRFAENQWDVVYYYNSKISSTNNDWIDLFGWGTSGWNSGAKAYQPYSTSKNNKDYYYPGGSYSNNLTGNYANADWGVYNKISNGGNKAGQWRTLTVDEWDYVLSGRKNAMKLNGIATVNGVNGLVLLPDNWSLPDGLTFDYAVNTYTDFTQNRYTATDWSKMEANGAVFLPAAGWRCGSDEFFDVGTKGEYWSSSGVHYESVQDCAGSMIFSNSYSDGSGVHIRCYGGSVRLVRDVK